MRAVAVPGRLVWGISGVVTAAALAVPGVHLLTSPWDHGQGQQIQGTVTRTVTLSQPVSSVNVESYGGSVQVTGARVSQVKVTETVGVPGPGSAAPPVAATVRDGQLTVGGPVCGTSETCVSFAVTVPRDVAVTVASEGGPVTVSGVAPA